MCLSPLLPRTTMVLFSFFSLHIFYLVRALVFILLCFSYFDCPLFCRIDVASSIFSPMFPIACIIHLHLWQSLIPFSVASSIQLLGFFLFVFFVLFHSVLSFCAESRRFTCCSHCSTKLCVLWRHACIMGPRHRQTPRPEVSVNLNEICDRPIVSLSRRYARPSSTHQHSDAAFRAKYTQHANDYS